MKELIKYQFQCNFIYGLYGFISVTGEVNYRLVSVENKKGNLSFQILGEYKEISVLKTSIKNHPVYLVLDGKGILLKNIKAEAEVSLVKQIIPSANEGEFIADTHDGADNLYVAIARKEQVDEIAGTLKQAGLNVIGLSLGPYHTANLLKYFSDLPEVISFDNHRIYYERQKQVITKHEKITDNSKSIIIDSQEVDSSFLPALSGALGFFLEEERESVHREIGEQKKEFQSKIIFQRAGVGLLILILAVLLANMFFYMHYSDRKIDLENQLIGNKNVLKTLDTLKRELEWKEKFMRESGILKNTQMAFYADRIAATVPNDITLDKLEIHPVVGKVRSNKEITLRPGIILLGGATKSTLDLNNWVHKLKDMPWIENVTILDYMQENEMNVGLFSIELKVKMDNK